MSRFKRKASLLPLRRLTIESQSWLYAGELRAPHSKHIFFPSELPLLSSDGLPGVAREAGHTAVAASRSQTWILFVSGLIVAGTIARDAAWELWLALEESHSLDAERCPGEGATLQSLPAPSLLGWRAGSLLPFPPPCQRAFGQGRERLVPRQVPRFHLDVLEVQGPHSQHCVCHSWTQTEGELSVEKASG